MANAARQFSQFDDAELQEGEASKSITFIQVWENVFACSRDNHMVHLKGSTNEELCESAEKHGFHMHNRRLCRKTLQLFVGEGEHSWEQVNPSFDRYHKEISDAHQPFDETNKVFLTHSTPNEILTNESSPTTKNIRCVVGEQEKNGKELQYYSSGLIHIRIETGNEKHGTAHALLRHGNCFDRLFEEGMLLKDKEIRFAHYLLDTVRGSKHVSITKSPSDPKSLLMYAKLKERTFLKIVLAEKPNKQLLLVTVFKFKKALKEPEQSRVLNTNNIVFQLI